MTRNKQTLIAITGGMGSGKSTVSDAVKELNYPVLSCDEFTAQVYREKEVIKRLKKIFPTAVKGRLFPKIDRAELARLAFLGDEEYSLLTEIVTTRIFELMMKKVKKLKGIVFVEVPLLFERKYQQYFDKVIVVLREREARIAAVEKRSNLSRSEIEDRLARQIDYDTTDFSAFRVIKNDGDIEELTLSAQNLVMALVKEIKIKQES